MVQRLQKRALYRVLVVVVGLATLSAGPLVAGQQKGWVSDLGQASKQAAESDKPIFIYFFATWCPPCKMLDSQTFSDDSVKKLLGEKFIATQIDVDKNRALPVAYDIPGTPTMIVAEPDGSETARWMGFVPPESMTELLTDLLKFRRARKAYARDPKNVKALLTVATMCADYAVTEQEKLKLVEAALKVVPEENKQQRGKLLLVRGRALASREKALAKAVKDFQAAARLDEGNVWGLKEAADWLIAVTDFGRTQNVAVFIRALNKFVADYPVGKIKDDNLRRKALSAQFQMLRRQGDFAAAIKTLETVKAEYAQSIDVAEVDRLVKQLRSQLKSAEAAKKPQDSLEKTEGGQQDGNGSE